MNKLVILKFDDDGKEHYENFLILKLLEIFVENELIITEFKIM